MESKLSPFGRDSSLGRISPLGSGRQYSSQMEVSHPDNSELLESMEGLSGMDKFSAYRNHKLGIVD